MIPGSLIIADSNPERRSRASAKLQAHGFTVIEADSTTASILKAHIGKTDLVLLRMGLSIDPFRELAEELENSGVFIVPIIEPGFSPALRKEALALKADGFINDDSPADEWIASLDALIRKKRRIDDLTRESQPNGLRAQLGKTKASSEAGDRDIPLRDRVPELYQDILHRYEEGVKLVLRHRIYKINDDIFEPFRQIAKQLFLAKATARDAVQLHYQTLRKIAPTPEAPGAQAYLEVGRTTIIGLLGDLLTFYRDAHRMEASEVESQTNSQGASTKGV